jgi:NAD(P)-dependent dehydrogenase (short-subunit alcohol dehydrogenase family)
VKAVLLGGTKGIGRALARLLGEKGHRLCLLGRDLEDVKRSAADVEARSGLEAGRVPAVYCDLARPDTFGPALDEASARLGGLDSVIVTAAAFAPQEKLESNRSLARDLLTTNFTHTVLFCEEARERLLARGGGTLCVLSSVSGDRARKPVILYGASKAGLSAYLEGLDHKFRSRGLKTILVKPGFVKTGMTAGLSPPPFAGEPEGVARDILAAIERGRPLVYTPAIWRWIMCAIRRLPRPVMRRLEF